MRSSLLAICILLVVSTLTSYSQTNPWVFAPETQISNKNMAERAHRPTKIQDGCFGKKGAFSPSWIRLLYGIQKRQKRKNWN